MVVIAIVQQQQQQQQQQQHLQESSRVVAVDGSDSSNSCSSSVGWPATYHHTYIREQIDAYLAQLVLERQRGRAGGGSGEHREVFLLQAVDDKVPGTGLCEGWGLSGVEGDVGEDGKDVSVLSLSSRLRSPRAGGGGVVSPRRGSGEMMSPERRVDSADGEGAMRRAVDGGGRGGLFKFVGWLSSKSKSIGHGLGDLGVAMVRLKHMSLSLSESESESVPASASV